MTAPVFGPGRLMFVKFRYGLGYESLCAEVSDSISWRRFCRMGLDAKVPGERERPAQDPMPLGLMVAVGSTGTRNRTSVTQAPPAPPAPRSVCPASAGST